MSLPLPNLDDRHFQDLVDDAKRMVQERSPEWSDHNVSDPGVTLIETFAFMVDQLIYRLNRVPDKLYLAFLDLVGVRPHAPGAATADTTFWLSAPQPEPVLVAAGVQVATQRTESEDAVVFETTSDLRIPPRRLVAVATAVAGSDVVQRALELREESGIACFGEPPALGDALLFGLDDAAPRCAVALRLDCDVQGAGVHPGFPPLRWEAWTRDGWQPCDLDTDQTGGLNRPGDVIIHVPAAHLASISGGVHGGWLRCVVTDPVGDYPPYRVSPQVRSVTAFTIGGTIGAVNAELVFDEVLGLSEGVSGQGFALARHPLVRDGSPLVLEVAGGSGWQEWAEVSSFAEHGPDDRVFHVDSAAGVIELPPAVREADGTVRRYGAIPPKAAPLRLQSYRFGGGPRGNVASRTLRVLRTSIPMVERVENRRPALGGVSAETLEEVRVRGPLDLRTLDRAVTAEDFEVLAIRSTPTLARVRCITEPNCGARLLVVPAAPHEADDTLRFEDLIPSESLLATLTEHLEERRVVGTRLVVEPPLYQGVTIVARLTARPRTDPSNLREAALRALYRYFDPLRGGPDGSGWPFGRPVQAGEVYAVLQRLPATELVEEVRLFAVDPLTSERGQQADRIELDANALVFSFGHQVRATKGR
ncbi:putative baseplate assembly protein [Humibacillus sp. DSM 29435]|uniref:putative baseplate assembly protein n=1 Tax=Humibacillus sp. DSM 29435 TaxID=1869167 RepID=UPI0008729CB2|nr:putative baseplate assembly protein [Humibacillus sp. DSM 29435]OFE15404.1 putative baseplate assembly protein [Humibacillus sp. DSM 29435]